MTIEQTLADLAEAIRQQTETIKQIATMYAKLNGGGPVKASAGEQAPKAEKPKAEKPKAEKPPAPAAPAPEPPASPSYDEVRAAVNRTMEVKGRDAVIGLLAEFKVKNAKEIDPGNWPSFLLRAGEVCDG